MRKLTILVMFVLVVGLAACGGGDSAGGGDGDAGGSASNGEELFNQSLIGAQPGCVTCHSLEPGVVMVGPSLAGIAGEAGNRVDGQSAEEYLTASIMEPDSYIVDGFEEGSMPAALATELESGQVDDLVAYLMTLE